MKFLGRWNKFGWKPDDDRLDLLNSKCLYYIEVKTATGYLVMWMVGVD